MPENQEGRYWIPTRTYDFELNIAGFDLTNGIMGINILTSIDVPYITVILSLFIDANDVLLKQIYGQNPLKLIIRHYGEYKTVPDEQLELDLMYVTSEYEFIMKSQLSSEITMRDRTPIQITTVCKDPFTIMNSYVNGVYIGKTVSEIVSELASTVNATVKYDAYGMNKEVIDQVLIPPITFYQALKYLNKTFGFFDGLSSFYCLQEKPQSTIYIKNLSNKMIASTTATIYQFATSGENSEIIEAADLAELGSSQLYYTYLPIESQYKGNSAFTIFGPRMVHIVKPSNRLFALLDINTAEFAKNYGLIYGGKTMYYDTSALDSNKRISFFKDHTGYELLTTHVNANWSKLLSDLASINITLDRNIFITPLMAVGEGVNFLSKIENMKDLQGKYILSSTEFMFSRNNREYSASAKLHLIRTNRTLE